MNTNQHISSESRVGGKRGEAGQNIRERGIRGEVRVREEGEISRVRRDREEREAAFRQKNGSRRKPDLNYYELNELWTKKSFDVDECWWERKGGKEGEGRIGSGGDER